jgi:hypothetical protein
MTRAYDGRLHKGDVGELLPESTASTGRPARDLRRSCRRASAQPPTNSGCESRCRIRDAIGTLSLVASLPSESGPDNRIRGRSRRLDDSG